jgi:hypothetical protein
MAPSFFVDSVKTCLGGPHKPFMKLDLIGATVVALLME